MITVANTGYITANKPFTEEVKAFVIEELGEQRRNGYTIKEDEIEFYEYYCNELNESIEFIIEHLAPLGYVLNGSIEYYYDWEGRYDIKDNKVTILSKEEMIICDADDAMLAKELEKRGFAVIKKGDHMDRERLMYLAGRAIGELIYGDGWDADEMKEWVKNEFDMTEEELKELGVD